MIVDAMTYHQWEDVLRAYKALREPTPAQEQYILQLEAAIASYKQKKDESH